MRNLFVMAVAFCVLPVVGHSQEGSGSGVIERWRCLTVRGVLTDTGGITLTRGELDDAHVGEGEVLVAEIAYRARFSMEGLERRWDFGEDGDYSVFVTPDGSGAYYDFSDSDPGETVTPSQTYHCRLVGEEEADEEAEPVDTPEEVQRRIEETERRTREAEMAEQLRQEMEEERRNQAIESGLLDQYKARIRQRIESNWSKPADSREDLMWVVLLNILPGNEIADIEFEFFNGSDADRRSVETAIRRSSPLPAPPVPELFERQLRLRYPPSVSGAFLPEGETVPIVRIDPQWPREALMDGTEGYVRCEVLIGPEGSVLDVRVLEAAPGRLFVRNAVRAVRRWKFKPRIVDGVAVERWATTSVVFELDD